MSEARPPGRQAGRRSRGAPPAMKGGTADTDLRPAIRALAYGCAEELAEAVIGVVLRECPVREVAREHQVSPSTLYRRSQRFKAALKGAIAHGYLHVSDLVGNGARAPQRR